MEIHRQDTRDPELNLQFKCIADAFIKDLSPDEKQLLFAANLTEAVLQDAANLDQRHNDKSSGRKVAKKLKPFIEGINQYGSALDVLSNSSSIFLCPIWGAARILLHLAKEFGEYFDKLTSMLERIGRDLTSLRRYPKLYPDNQRLKQHMVQIYQIIFDLCAKARHVFLKGGEGDKKYLCKITPVSLRTLSKLTWKPFKQQFKDLQERLDETMDIIKDEVDLAEHEESNLERQKAEKERQLQRVRWDLETAHITEVQSEISRAQDERDIQRIRWKQTLKSQQLLENFIGEQDLDKLEAWLCPADYSNNHKAALNLRHEKTGTWFIYGDEFQKWCRTDNSFLWLHAKPGAGKTVLLAGVIDYLQHDVPKQNAGLAYFYCDYKDSRKQTPSSVISALIFQFAKQSNKVLQRLEVFLKEHQDGSRASTPGFDELRSNFSNFLGDSFDKVFIAVDALDECTDRGCVMYALQGLVEIYPALKVLVSSREERQIVDIFHAWTFPRKTSLRIRQNDVADDILSFVRSEVTSRIRAGKLNLRDETLKKTICNALVDGADGM